MDTARTSMGKAAICSPARRLASMVGLIGFMAGLTSPAAYAVAPPNIILILADDQGWRDTSVHMDPSVPGSRNTNYQTPNLESLANAGMRFGNGYSAAPQCAQTRASLLTGKSPAQLQMTELVWFQTGNPGALPLSGPIPELFNPTQPTIPRLVKQADADYQTALFGKWHLELPTTTTPQASGFDQFQKGGNSFNDPQGVFRIAQLTNNFMHNSVAAGKPFFVQVAHDAVHELYRPDGSAWIAARPALVEKYQNMPGFVGSPEYAALLEDLDASVGQVLNKVDELGIADNTYIIYVSDNGGTIKWTSNAPLKSGKGTINEGGIRIPFMVKGPGIQAGSFSNLAVSTTDLMSTIASLVGYADPMPAGVEGADLSPVLFNGGQLPQGMAHLDREFSQHGELYFHYPHYAGNGATKVFRPASAVRDGDFKLYVEYDELGGPDKLYLYDLAINIGETVNLAGLMPQKASELKGMLDNYLTAVDASMAYDVKTPIQLSWDASQAGADPNGWRSTIDVNYKGRETWALGGGAEKPTAVNASPYQPGLPEGAYSFDGNDVMRHVYFHVGDKVPRNTAINNINVGTNDYDRSASLDMWFRVAGLNSNQVLFESGDGTSGLSLTLGDADANGSFNDLRLCIRSADGRAYDVTAPIDSFANPVVDFINATAVVNDSETNRYLELYVNGALAGRVDVPTGAANSLNWDGYDQAGLGRPAGGLGGNGGAGNLPFNGAFVGQMALIDFWNHAIPQSAIAGNYNARLDPVWLGIQSSAGDAVVPATRPADLRLGAAESNDVFVIEERRGVTSSSLAVNAVVSGAASIHIPTPGEFPQLPGDAHITSYLLHFDPVGSNAAGLESVTGSVTFDEDIVAILYEGALMSASDAVLGSIGNYGLATDRGVQWLADDYLTVSDDQRTLSFRLTVPGDELLQFRVLTDWAVPGPDADFNHDGVVDGLDLIAWSGAFGASASADADHDGDTDGNDFLAWQRNLGAAPPSTRGAAVPEPSAAALLALAAIVGAVWTRSALRA